MAKKVYFGVDSKARAIKKMFVGVNGVARKVKKGYIGVNGVARPFYSGNTTFFGTILAHATKNSFVKRDMATGVLAETLNISADVSISSGIGPCGNILYVGSATSYSALTLDINTLAQISIFTRRSASDIHNNGLVVAQIIGVNRQGIVGGYSYGSYDFYYTNPQTGALINGGFQTGYKNGEFMPATLSSFCMDYRTYSSSDEDYSRSSREYDFDTRAIMSHKLSLIVGNYSDYPMIHFGTINGIHYTYATYRTTAGWYTWDYQSCAKLSGPIAVTDAYAGKRATVIYE